MVRARVAFEGRKWRPVASQAGLNERARKLMCAPCLPCLCVCACVYLPEKSELSLLRWFRVLR